MGPDIWVSGVQIKTSKMEGVRRSGKMDLGMKDFGKMTWLMEEEGSFMLMETSMKVTG
jgi:hypothetical protein